MTNEFDINRTADVVFNVKQNDTFYFNFQVQNNQGYAIDFSAYNFARMQARADEFSSPVINFSSTGGTIDISNKSSGQFIINGSLDIETAGQYFFDFELQDTINNITHTVLTGKINVENDYAR